MAVVSSGMYMSGKILKGGTTDRIMNIRSRGLAEDIQISSGGTLYTASTGRLTGGTVGASGIAYVLAGGMAHGIIINGGELRVSSGGIVISANITKYADNPYSGGMSIYTGGSAIDCTVTDNYHLNVRASGTAIRPVTSGSGQIAAYNNTTNYIKDLIMRGGVCSAAGTVDGATLSGGGIRISGLGYNINVGGHGYSATCNVATTNGRAYNVHVYSSGRIIVSSGAHAYNVIRESNASVDVQSGGVLDGGYMSKHGSVDDYPLVRSGGVIRNVTFDVPPALQAPPAGYTGIGPMLDHCIINSGTLQRTDNILKNCTIKMVTGYAGTGARATYENTKFIGPPASNWMVSSASTMSNTIIDNAVVVIYDSVVNGLTLKGGSAGVSFYKTTSGKNVTMQDGKMHIRPDASVSNVTITSGVLNISGVASNVTKTSPWVITNSSPCRVLVNGGTVYNLKAYGGGSTIDGVDIDNGGAVIGYVGGNDGPGAGTIPQYTVVRRDSLLTNFQQTSGWIYAATVGAEVCSGKTNNVCLRAYSSGIIHDVTAIANSAHASGTGTIYNCTFYGVNSVASGANALISNCTMHPNDTTTGTVAAMDGGTIVNCDIDSCTTYVSSGGYMESCIIRHAVLAVSSGGSAEHIVRATASNGATASSLIRGGTITDFVGCPGATIYNSGGLIDGLITPGYVYISNGGIVRNAKMTTSQGGGYPRMYVYSGCVVSGGVTYDVGQIIVSSNGLAISCIMSGGYMYASNGGTISSSIIRGGQMSAPAGGAIKDVTISGGIVYCQWGGQCSGATLYNGGKLSVGGQGNPPSTANNVVINAGGTFAINAGCSGNEIVVSSNGTLSVGSAGTATNVTSKTGAIITVATGGTITYK